MKVYCLSLGCAKNRVDSECLAGELERAGHVLVDDIGFADVGIVNTCGFIQPATEESIAAILPCKQVFRRSDQRDAVGGLLGKERRLGFRDQEHGRPS